MDMSKEQKYDPNERIPAFPPEDYKGSQADWMVELQARGFWDGEGWYGDVYLKAKDWWDILEKCEQD